MAVVLWLEDEDRTVGLKSLHNESDGYFEGFVVKAAFLLNGFHCKMRHRLALTLFCS